MGYAKNYYAGRRSEQAIDLLNPVNDDRSFKGVVTRVRKVAKEPKNMVMIFYLRDRRLIAIRQMLFHCCDRQMFHVFLWWSHMNWRLPRSECRLGPSRFTWIILMVTQSHLYMYVCQGLYILLFSLIFADRFRTHTFIIVAVTGHGESRDRHHELPPAWHWLYWLRSSTSYEALYKFQG
jgi:hypothetical protein